MSEHPDLQPTKPGIEAVRERSVQGALAEASGRSYRPAASSAHDLFHQLDWLRDEWGHDEFEVAKKLSRLERTVRSLLPEPARGRSLELIRELCRARIVAGVDWRDPIARLGLLASTAAPRKGFVCGFDYGAVKCQIRFDSEASLGEHRETVHRGTA